MLRAYVEEKLTACWSPMQISERLLVDHPGDASMRVSHETIYTSLFVQTKAVLRPELTAKLRTRRGRPRPPPPGNATPQTKPNKAKAAIRDTWARRVICSSVATAAVIWSPWSSGTAATCWCYPSKTQRAGR